MSTHLPIRAIQPLQRQCLLQRVECRSFSTTLARPRGATSKAKQRHIDPVQTAAAVRNQIRTGRASSVMHMEQLKDESNLPDDIGLLPGTFIRKPIFPGGLSFASIRRHISSGTYQIDPSRTSDSLPLRNLSTQSDAAGNKAWYRKLWARLVYDVKYRIAKIKGLILLARFKYLVRKIPTLHWWHRVVMKNLAREKYVHMYRCFASGDSKALSEMCTAGVLKSFQERIAARPRGLTGTWKLDTKRDVAVSVVSNRALLLSLSGYDDTGVQQIVLRMRSTQSLQWDTKSQKSKYNPQKGEVLEYLVLQRQIIRGVFKEWKVWGFAKEWDMETIQEDAQLERDLNAFQGEQAT